MNRRTFLKLAGLCGSTIFLNGCRRPTELFEAITATISPSASPRPVETLPPSSTHTPTPGQAASPTASPTLTLEPAATPSPPGARIVLVKSEDRLQGVQRALDLLEAGDFRGKRLVVKPNYNSADPAPGSTDNEILIPTLQWLQDRGADRLEVWDRSGMGNTRAVMQQKGLPGLADDYGFEYFPFDDLRAEDWVMISFEGSYWPDGFPLARPILEADGVVSLCCLKTHRFGGHFTLSLKNSVGMVAKTVPGQTTDYMAGILHRSAHQRELIADINRAYSPDLIVLDGIQAFINQGPEIGQVVQPGVILVGSDRVAMDAVGVAILRLYGTTPEVQNGPIFEQAQIARAAALGLGVDKPEKIELVTDDRESSDFANEIRRVLLED